MVFEVKKSGIMVVLYGVLSAIILFSFVGCSLTDNSKYKSVKDENRKTEFLLNSYENNYVAAAGYESDLKEGLIMGCLSGFDDSIKTIVEDIHNDMLLNIAKYNSIEDLSEIVRDLNIVTVVNNAEVYYFFDDENGLLEQYFILRVPNNHIYKLSLLWLKGECIEGNKDIYY